MRKQSTEKVNTNVRFWIVVCGLVWCVVVRCLLTIVDGRSKSENV